MKMNTAMISYFAIVIRCLPSLLVQLVTPNQVKAPSNRGKNKFQKRYTDYANKILQSLT